jgi:mannose-6-phosphate isomerase
MVWGGRGLGEVLGKSLAGPEAYGESWEASDHPLHRSVVASGPLAGRSLRDLMEHDRHMLLGPAAGAHAVFPWLVKFLDAHDWLSVQVHPDEQAVKRLWPGEGSKTEAWFIIDVKQEGRIYAGLLPGVDEGRFRAALAAGTVADCLYRFTPRPGDCVFLPAGTVHAVGGGVLMAEVQQTSDATFRLFDWDRRDAQGKTRKLHIEEALVSIHWDQGPVHAVRAAAFNDPPGACIVQPLVHCRYFELDYLSAGEPFPCGGTGRLQALVVLRGRGRLDSPTAEEMATGQVWLLPAGMIRTWCRPNPELAGLLCTLPGD